MNCMGLLINNDPNLRVCEWYLYRNILDKNGDPVDFQLILTPIAGWLINDGDEGVSPIPLLANGRTAGDDDIFILVDLSSWHWEMYEYNWGIGEQELRDFIVKEARNQLEYELEQQKEKDEAPKPKPGKIHHLKKPGGGK